jgi:hypothetical protein
MSDANGFLTSTDRAFLRGEKEYTGNHAKQQRYERRKAVRERTRAALWDFSILFHTLDDDELEKVRTVPIDERDQYDRAVSDTFAFLYRLCSDEYDERVVDGVEQAVEHERDDVEHVSTAVRSKIETTVVTDTGEVEQDTTITTAGTHSDPAVTSKRIAAFPEHYVEAFEQLEGHFKPENYERLLAAVKELDPE